MGRGSCTAVGGGPALSHRGFDHGVGGFPNSGRFGVADLGRAYRLVV
jgi:hypothetical protein